jgi:hypothetical protein
VGLAAGTLVLCVSLTIGIAAQETDRFDYPEYIIEVSVAPAAGPMQIPHEGQTAWPYAVEIDISFLEGADVRPVWVPRVSLRPGDRIEKDDRYGPHRIRYTVSIDPEGESAKVHLLVVRDGNYVLEHRVNVSLCETREVLPSGESNNRDGDGSS